MAIPFAAIGGAASAIGGLFGLFKKKPKPPSVQDNILAQADAARKASDQYGFNPLTMLQYGNPGGTGMLAGDGPAPLASIQLLTSGLQGLDDVFSGDAARRRAADQLELDMAKVKLDQVRHGVVGPVAADSIAATRSPLGRRAAVAVSPGGSVHKAGRLTMAAAPVGTVGAARPPQSPFDRSAEMIPVVYADGKRTMIPRGVADRLDIDPFGTVIAGDIEEIKGEAVGNVETSIRAPDISNYVHNGVPVAPIFSAESVARTYRPPSLDVNSSDKWWNKPLFGKNRKN